MKFHLKKCFSRLSLVTLAIFVNISTTYASTTTGLPWETPMQKILASLTGPVAKVIGVVVIVLAGFGLAFGESGIGMRRICQIVLGLSIAFIASSLVVTLFGFSGGAVF